MTDARLSTVGIMDVIDETERQRCDVVADDSVDTFAQRATLLHSMPIGVGTTKADDSSLPESLRGKNLVIGTSPVATWGVGVNETRDGRVFLVDQRAQSLLLQRGNALKAPAPFTYRHEDGDFRNAGYGVGFSVDDKYIYVDKAYWTQAAAADLASGERGPVSPECAVEPLDPVTFETLTKASALYVGPGKGWYGSSYKTNTFRPVDWIVPVSLVTVPAQKHLPHASLGVETTAPPASQPTRKENTMDPKLLKLLGLANDASDEVKSQALRLYAIGLGLPPDATESQCLAAHDSREVEKAAAAKKAAEDVETQRLAAQGRTDAERETQAAADRKKQAKEQADLIRQELAAQKAFDDFDKEVLDAEKDGRITGDKDGIVKERASWHQMYKINPEFARQKLSSLPKVGPGENNWAPPSITGNGRDASLSVDNLPRAEAEEKLSRACAWTAEKYGGVVAQFPKALADVRGGDAGERDYHSRVQRARRGETWEVDVQSAGKFTSLQQHPDYDPQKVAFIRQRIRDNKIPEDVLPRELQEAAVGYLESQRLSDVGNFQPPTRFPIDLAVGPLQGEYAADEVAPPITGGVNEQASYPVYGTESQQAIVGEDGYPMPIGYKDQHIEESSLNVQFVTVTLEAYGNQVRVDKRAGAASVVLPYGFLADATMQALAIEKNKREIFVSKLVTNVANYDALNQFGLSGARQWDDPASQPLKDLRLASAQMRNLGPLRWLIPFDPLTALSYHPDFIHYAQVADTGTGRPDGYASINHITAVLGPIISPTALISTRRGGTAPSSPWGTNVIGFVSNRGVLRAPRSFANVVAGGAPQVITETKRLEGYIGVDFVKVSDMYMPQIVGVGNNGRTVTTPTTSAFIFTTASGTQGHASL